MLGMGTKRKRVKGGKRSRDRLENQIWENQGD